MHRHTVAEHDYVQGCAVIWSYIELFGQSAIKGCVFVDQAPLQNLAHDWKLGSKGCYDIASLTRMQCALETDFASFARGMCSYTTCSWKQEKLSKLT